MNEASTTHDETAALLVVAPTCPHCGTMIDTLTRLVKAGTLGRLEILDATRYPDRVHELKVRSVPWLRVGPFEFIGNYPASELTTWITRAATGQGRSAYCEFLLVEHRLADLIALIERSPALLRDVLEHLWRDDTPLSVRIGISAVVEAFADTPTLRAQRDLIEQLALAPAPQTRADACHFLGLTGDARALPTVSRLLDDDHPDVREIAAETFALLEGRSEVPDET